MSAAASAHHLSTGETLRGLFAPLVIAHEQSIEASFTVRATPTDLEEERPRV